MAVKEVTLSELRTTKKVLRYMQEDFKKTPSYQNAEGTLAIQMMEILIKHADYKGKELRK